jgi:hypothetical protein
MSAPAPGGSPPLPDPETLRLIHDEISARAARLDTSTGQLDTKATTLLGFVLAAATFLAAQKALGWWKLPAFLAFAAAAFCGIQALRPREFKVVPQPAVLETLTGHTERAVLAVLIAAKVQAFAPNERTHKEKANWWVRALLALTLAIALVVVALVFGGSHAADRQQPARGQPTPAATSAH